MNKIRKRGGRSDAKLFRGMLAERIMHKSKNSLVEKINF